jgi:hypothetical protein
MRNRTVTAMGLVAVCALANTAPAAAAPPKASPSGTADSLRVWAYFDGDTPVEGGRVRVYAGDQLLPEVDAADTEERTFPEGTALVRFSSLPRDIRVVVTGGYAGGRQLQGSLTAEVHGATDGTLVEVNPVTTLSDAWTDAGRGRSLGRGRNVIEGLLGIPRILDDQDLRAADRWFDGDTFERYALAHGGVTATVKALVRYVDRPGDQRRVFRARPRRRTKAFGAASPVKVSIEKGANKVLGAVLDGITKAAALTGPEGVVFGLVMKGITGAISLKFGAKDEVDDVKESLNGIAAQLTRLETQLGKVAFQSEVSRTRDLLVSVAAAQDDLDFSVRLDLTTEKGRNAFAEGRKWFLIHAGELATQSVALNLHTALTRHQTTQAPEGKPPLLPTFRRELDGERFLTRARGLRMAKFYAFYETQEVRLATLLSEYHMMLNEPATAERRVTEIRDKYLPRQLGELPPALQATPQRLLDPLAFIDTKHNLMWGVQPAFRSAKQIAETGFSRCEASFSNVRTCESVDVTAQFAGFSDWRLPTTNQAKSLFADRSVTDPVAWLEKAGVSFDPGQTQQFGVSFVLREKLRTQGNPTGAIFNQTLVVKPGPGPYVGRTIRPPQLYNQMVARGCDLRTLKPTCRDPLAAASGFILWVRPITPEYQASYWE